MQSWNVSTETACVSKHTRQVGGCDWVILNLSLTPWPST
jgi:hypothetical protein